MNKLKSRTTKNMIKRIFDIFIALQIKRFCLQIICILAFKNLILVIQICWWWSRILIFKIAYDTKIHLWLFFLIFSISFFPFFILIFHEFSPFVYFCTGVCICGEWSYLNWTPFVNIESKYLTIDHFACGVCTKPKLFYALKTTTTPTNHTIFIFYHH